MQQYIVYGWDGTDDQALDRRMKVRPAHFEGAARLKASGNFILGGAMLDDNGRMIGSTMVLQFESRDQLQQWLDEEPYVTGGVWENVEIHPFRVAQV